MPQTSHAAISAEAMRRSLADDGRTSLAERFRIRNQIRAELGLPPERHQRGGVAGAFDRNKDFAIPLAAISSGLGVGGPVAGGGVAGVARGLDREGESGIGFDTGAAARGFGEGALTSGAANFTGGLIAGAGALGAGAAGAGGAAGTAATTAGGAVPAAAASGGLAGAARTAGGWLARNGLGVITAVDAANQRQQQDDRTEDAIAADRARWDASAPLREAGMNGLLNPTPIDTTNLSSLASTGNPFAVPAPAFGAPNGPSGAPGFPSAVPATPRANPLTRPANAVKAIPASRKYAPGGQF